MSMHEKKRFGYIFCLTLIAFILMFIMIILVIVLSIDIKNNNSNIDNDFPWITKPKPTNNDNLRSNFICTVFVGVMSLCLSIVSAILILSYKWETKWCKDNKKLWGLLSMFILFFIGSTIFLANGYSKSSTSNKKLSDLENDIIKKESFDDEYDGENPFKSDRFKKDNDSYETIIFEDGY